MKELTLRSLLLGAAITVVFTAANVYLGLRVGMTFASSIPAAVISMAVLRLLKNGDIRENNIVQTVASAAGTLSSVIFVLPGLLMIGWWKDVPFWPTFTACAAGGVLGVLYTIPLRRAMVVDSDLPYPEGVAAAEVLLVGMGSRADAEEASAENRAGLRILSGSALASTAFAALAAARVFASDVAAYVRVGPAATGLNFWRFGILSGRSKRNFAARRNGSGCVIPISLAGESFAPFANVLGAAAFIACMAGLYGWVARTARR